VIGLSGVLVCSFLGGMKAVTWTQVAQYIILIIAYMIPVTFLSLKLTGFPIPQLSYGQALQNITRLESELKIATESKARDGTGRVIQGGYVPAYNEGLNNAAAVTAINQINTYFGVNITPPKAQSIPDTSKPAEEIQPDWRGTPWNFLALTFCLMVGTAGLPHILIRFYTVPSVRESRLSVGWALFFIFLLYFTAPAYAAFARWEILQNVVGKEISSLPEWTQNWSRLGLITQRDYTTLDGRDIDKLPAWAAPQVKSGALVITDANGNGKIDLAGATFSETEVDGKKIGVFGELSGTAITKTSIDGILQFSELNIDPDTIVLATPEIAGLPYTVAALIAAGGMAAALSTADGLLVVISSAIAHDFYYRIINPKASMNTRIWLGKTMLVVAAVIAALLALPRLALIAQMVAWAFSMAASSFFPVVLLGIFWKRCNGPGAIAGMVGGLSVTLFYMYSNYVDPSFNVLGITHLAAGIFGMPVNFLLCYIVSKLTAAPSQEIQDLVDHLRSPELDDELMTSIASGKQAAGAR
jgi:cation/acetate symporter